MAFNPYGSLSPTQDGAQHAFNHFRYNLIPSDVVKEIEFNADTTITTVLNEDGSEQQYNTVDCPELILEWIAHADTVLDNGGTIDAWLQEKIDSGRLTAV